MHPCTNLIERKPVCTNRTPNLADNKVAVRQVFERKVPGLNLAIEPRGQINRGNVRIVGSGFGLQPAKIRHPAVASSATNAA